MRPKPNENRQLALSRLINRQLALSRLINRQLALSRLINRQLALDRLISRAAYPHQPSRASAGRYLPEHRGIPFERAVYQ